MRLTRKLEAEILVRIKKGLRRRFPIGCQVRLSREGRRALGSKYADAIGDVVAYSHGVSPSVVWRGWKTRHGYAWVFLSRVRPRKSNQ